MGYLTNGLTFNALRGANMARLPQFRNKHGQPAHSRPDGSDWTPAQWLQAVVGELGEFANIRKKFERGDLTFEEYQAEAARELADVQCYLDLLAMRCLDHDDQVHPNGVDLGRATMEKWNAVSERVGSSVRLAGDDWHHITGGVGWQATWRNPPRGTPSQQVIEGCCGSLQCPGCPSAAEVKP